MLHRVQVARDWLEEGATLAIELPRNLRCAGCEGGGCDGCGRSGAVTLRSRQDPPEVLKIVVPKLSESGNRDRAVTLRIPERGGRADNPDLPRGILMLSVAPGEVSDPGVERLDAPLAVAPESGPSEIRRRPPAPVLLLLVTAVLLLALLAASLLAR